MRSAGLLVIVVAACGRDEVVPPFTDAPSIDASTIDSGPQVDAQTTCSSATGTADVSTTGPGSGAATYARLYAGAVWLIGPVAPPTGHAGAASTMVTLLFTDQDPVDGQRLFCCEYSDPTCCMIDTLVGTTAELMDGMEVGTHDVTFRRTTGPGFEVPATVTITDFTDPFTAEPGRVAGSIAADDGTRTITGTFDNTFCPAFLTATI
jgi:hypothetical protein